MTNKHLKTEEMKPVLYPIIFYTTGLIIGTALYKFYIFNGYEMNPVTDVNGFTALFLNRLEIYLAVYFTVIFFATSIIGYPIIMLTLFLTGISAAFRVSYFYMEYKTKGIGYSLLMVIPQTALFNTVLIITVSKAVVFSKSLFNSVIKRTDTVIVNRKPYLNSFALCLVYTVFAAFLNSLLIYLLSSVVSL